MHEVPLVCPAAAVDEIVTKSKSTAGALVEVLDIADATPSEEPAEAAPIGIVGGDPRSFHLKGCILPWAVRLRVNLCGKSLVQSAC